MKILIFGSGNFFKWYSPMIPREITIVGIVDNNISKQGQMINGIKVYSVEEGLFLSHDKIIIASNKTMEMKNQLETLGVDELRIQHIFEFLHNYNIDRYAFYKFGDVVDCSKRNFLIITDRMGFNGGSIAAVSAAEALMLRGYAVVIATPAVDDYFLEYIRNKRINIIVCFNLYFPNWSEINWIEKYDCVLVNTYSMLYCAGIISIHKRISIWLHESEVMYEAGKYYAEKTHFNSANVTFYAVSKVARNNLLEHHKLDAGLLPLGIMDEGIKNKKKNNDTYKSMVFATIGTIKEIKGQRVLLDAIKKCNNEFRDVFFLFIGKNSGDKYCKDIEEEAKKVKNIRMVGELSRSELMEEYTKIDVVVIPSRQETFSLTALEGLMFSKVVIVSDVVGLSDYIHDGENGFVFSDGNSKQLSDKIRWIVQRRNELGAIKEKARLTYESNFTLMKFGERLEEALYI